MDFSSINWLAVVISLVASMIIGSLWFNPKTFYPGWWKALGEPKNDDVFQPAFVWGGTILASLVQAVFINLMVNLMGSVSGGTSLASGALAGFFLWLGFVAPSSLTNKLFAGQFRAWLYEVGNHLVTFIAMGAISGALA